MGFAEQIRQFSVKVDANSRAVFANSCSALKNSITDGSPLTGSPGQPVDTGNLKASWILDFDTPTSAVISTNVAYAPVIEDGVRLATRGQVTGNTVQRLTLRSQVGGFHSLALSIAGFDRIVADEAAKVAP